MFHDDRIEEGHVECYCGYRRAWKERHNGVQYIAWFEAGRSCSNCGCRATVNQLRNRAAYKMLAGASTQIQEAQA